MPIPICFAIDNTLETKSSAFFFLNELERQKMLTSKIRGEHFFTCAVLLSLMTLAAAEHFFTRIIAGPCRKEFLPPWERGTFER